MRSGGSYRKEKPDGEAILVETPTRDHPEGNRARPAGDPPTPEASAGQALPRRKADNAPKGKE